MAGSFQHLVTANGGNFSFDLIENMGDAYEMAEECFEMILFLTGEDPQRIAEAWMHGHLLRHRPDLTGVQIEQMKREYANKFRSKRERNQ